MNVTIRRAQIQDIEVLLPLVRGYREFYKQPHNPLREHAFIEAHLRAGTSVIYIADFESNAAGFAQLFKAYSTVHLAPSWILEDLFVAAEYRNRSIAKALLATAITHAKTHGAAGLFLETAHDNETAQRVYERAGWVRDDRFYKYNAPLA